MFNTKSILISFCAVLLVAGLGLGGAAAGAAFSDRAFGSGDLAAALAQARRAAQLDAYSGRLTESSRACYRIRTELVEGRLSLAEAVDAMLAENARRPEAIRLRLERFPGRTDAERCARGLLRGARHWLADEEPARREAVLGRLQAQLQEIVQPGA